MSKARKEVGKAGEDLACEYLSSQGQMILERNWRHGHHEVDIITFDKKGLHFVEVKTRVEPVALAPQESVGWAKKMALTAAALEFLHSSQARAIGSDLELFFDIVAIVYNGARVSVEYFPQAFIPFYM